MQAKINNVLYKKDHRERVFMFINGEWIRSTKTAKQFDAQAKSGVVNSFDITRAKKG